jgi:hypothetical protein
MRSTSELNQLVTANLRARRDPFDGFTSEERADYAETVRIENEVRAATEREAATDPAAPIAQPSTVPYVEVSHETAYGQTLRFSRAIRVF